MDSDQMQPQNREDDELTRRLEAFAEARLTPELSATTRMRAQVMTAAHRAAALARADADRAVAGLAIAAQAQADRTRASTWRRPLTALLAAGLTLGVGVGSVSAAQAGGPLYSVRIWMETLTLPSEANARAQAELQRLEERLAEAAAASASGDTAAASAALDAYAAIVNEATDDAGNDVSAAATLDAGVRSNIDVLSVLVERFHTGHGQAGEAIERALEEAIDRSDSALDKMHEPPNTTSPAVDPTKPPKTEKTANPNRATDDPSHATPKPKPTPRVDSTTEPAATPEPDRTPRGGPPSAPPGGGNGGAGNGGGGNGSQGGDTGD